MVAGAGSAKKKKIAGAAALVAVLAGGAVAWSNRHDGARDDALVLRGNVDMRQVALAFDGSGRIAALHAEEGQRVKAGDVLAVLDTRTLELRLDQASAQVEGHRQSLLRLRNGSRPEEIAQARSRLAAAEAEAQRAGSDLVRLQGIAGNTQGRGVSAQALERAASEADVARARVAEQRDALRLAVRGPRAEDVAGAGAQLEAAQAQAALLRHDIALGTLKAPSDAIVRSRLLEVGDMAAPQRPVFALALHRPKWVRVYVGEPDLGRIAPGMAAGVSTDSHPQPLAGKVGYISSVAEFTPKTVQTEELRTSLVYEVRVLVDDPGDQLRLGQPASVRLAAGRRP
jgi:HlyD family secretion protein